MAEKQTQRTRKQHYVPQTYLRRFSKDGRTLWVFDKVKQRGFPANSRDIAQEDWFYELSDDTGEDSTQAGERDTQAAEKALARLDALLGPDLDLLVEQARAGTLDPGLQHRLAQFIILQFFRTRQTRDALFAGQLAFLQALVNEESRRSYPDLPPPRVVVHRENLPDVHVSRMFDTEVNLRLAATLMSQVWVVWENKTRQPLYTSDHPVVRRAAPDTGGGPRTWGLPPTVEVAFPLSSRYLLAIYPVSHAPVLPGRHGQVVTVFADRVEHFNILQVRQSHRQVFCEVNEFEQAAGVCKSHLAVCDPDRKQVEVVVEGDDIGFLYRE